VAKKYVIAGNREQANQWIKNDLTKRQNAGETTLSWSDYVIVNEVMKLRGVRDPRGVFVGTWRERSDVVEILDALFIACVNVNKELQAIRNSVISKRPTPKIQGLRAESMIIDEAAQLLSDEIDKEVIKQLMHPPQQAPQQAVDTNTLITQLIKAVQELNAKVERLEKADNEHTTTNNRTAIPNSHL
jgi:hypothetical protein